MVDQCHVFIHTYSDNTGSITSGATYTTSTSNSETCQQAVALEYACSLEGSLVITDQSIFFKGTVCVLSVPLPLPHTHNK
jgi:hypothetical protein